MQQQTPTLSQLRPPAPPQSYLQPTHAYPQLQQNVASSHGSQNPAGRPLISNLGGQSQQYLQHAGAVQPRPTYPGATQPSANQNNVLRNNQGPVSTEQHLRATSRPTMPLRQGDHVFEKSVSGQGPRPSAENAAQKVSNDLDAASGLGSDSVELKTVKSETDTMAKDAGDSEPGSHAVENGELVKRMVKEEGVERGPELLNIGKSGELVAEVKKDVSNASPRHLDNVATEDRENEGDPMLKNLPFHETAHADKLSGKTQKDGSEIRQPSTGADESTKTLSMTSAPDSHGPAQNVVLKGTISQGPVVDEHRSFPPASQVQSGAFTQSSHSGPIADQGQHFEPSTLRQRPGAPLLQAPPPLLPHHTHVAGHPSSQLRPNGHGHVPEHFQAAVLKQSQGIELLPGGMSGPGSTTSFGRGPGYYGFPRQNFELQPIALQGPRSQGHALPIPAAASRMSQGESIGGAFGTLPPGAIDSHGGMMARPPPLGPEGLMGQRHPTNPMEAESLINHRPSYIDGRRSDLHLPGPFGPGAVGPTSSVMRSNVPPSLESSSALGLRDDRFKPFPDERSNSFVGRHGKDRGEFEDDLNQFPRPSRLDGEPVPKFGSYSRPHEIGPYGLNNDTGLKLDPRTGSAHSRFLPPYDGRERPVGLPDSAHNHPDFLGPATGYARRHMDGLNPRSPVREYPGISSRGFGGLPGHSGLDDFDGREPRRFGDPLGNSFHESRFPPFPNHLQRGEFEGPSKLRMGEHLRSGDMIGLDGHLRRGEHLGPHNLPNHMWLGEPIGFGDYPGHARMGELAGLGNFEPFGAGNRQGHPRFGEPGFRSRYSLQVFPSDGGINTGEADSFGNPRKRKMASTGWCRICKVDCETVGGLELHSQTREHQKVAMDMVRSIKQNAKKQKLSTSDHSALEDASKSKNTSSESHGNKL